MKFSTFIVIVLLGIGGGWFAYHSPWGPRLQALIQDSFKEKPDPKRDLAKMAANLPRNLRPGETVSEVSTYIEHKDDPIFPIVGYLTFVGLSRYEYVFVWDNDHWVFSQMFARNPDHDITTDPVGMEIMNGPEMTRFLYPYKNPPTRTAAAQDPLATPHAATPAVPVISVAPRRTPTPQENALDIARKYGSQR